MRKITAYNFITLNGYYSGPHGDLSWHRHDAEETGFANESLASDNMLLFGRITYEMMAGWWPSPMALENNPNMAAGMNKADKIVFSNTLKQVDWNNTTLISGNIIDQIRTLKNTSGKNMTILGSGSIISQFTDHGLIDEYLFMLDPVALPDGKTSFKGIKQKLDLKLTGTRTFKSGVVLLSYEPL
jgi:dihydrofolate reductase